MGGGIRRAPSYAALRDPEALDAYAKDMGYPCPKKGEERYHYQGVGDDDCFNCMIAVTCHRANLSWTVQVGVAIEPYRPADDRNGQGGGTD